MGSPVLLLRLEGPLQSWGGRSRWDVRDTQTEPTKSGIVGLLGCALGYPTRDPRLEELDHALRFGVRVEAAGRIRQDYQTITDFLPTADGRYKHSGVAIASSLDKLRGNPDVTPSTILSPRFYLEDAAFLVGLEAREPEGETLLAACAEAVQNPRWPLFLGRKCCIPSRPIFDFFGTDYTDLKDALTHREWSWLRGNAEKRELKPKEKPDELIGYLEDPKGARRQDALRVNPSRQYDFITMQPILISAGEVMP
jgi:CRISPR system Cascade subunit CasD